MTAPITMTSEVVADEDRYTRLGDGEQRLFRFRIGATEIGTMLVSVPLRFIGYVVIHPPHRGRGYARSMFELATRALGGELALERNPRPEALRVVDSLRRSSEWVVDDHPTIRVAYWTVPRVDYPADVGDPALRLRLRDTIAPTLALDDILMIAADRGVSVDDEPTVELTDEELRAMGDAAPQYGDEALVLMVSASLGGACGDMQCDPSCLVRRAMRRYLAGARGQTASAVDERFDFGGAA